MPLLNETYFLQPAKPRWKIRCWSIVARSAVDCQCFSWWVRLPWEIKHIPAGVHPFVEQSH
jgi:hypothetical protein